MAFTLLYIFSSNATHDNATVDAIENTTHDATRHSPGDTKLTNHLRTLAAQFAADDAGFIISAELVLVSTIAVLALVVGLAEVSSSINNELEDVGSAFGSLNQSFNVRGQAGCGASATGTYFEDFSDDCDSQCDISCGPVSAES